MSSQGTGKFILIVEDNEKNMRLVRDVLQFHGFRTVEATTGEDAVLLASEETPDLVLMDVSLPGIDGVEATRQLKTMPSMANVPIVALTASVTQADRARFGDAGFAGLIAKPIDVLSFPAQLLAFLPPSAHES